MNRINKLCDFLVHCCWFHVSKWSTQNWCHIDFYLSLICKININIQNYSEKSIETSVGGFLDLYEVYKKLQIGIQMIALRNTSNAHFFHRDIKIQCHYPKQQLQFFFFEISQINENANSTATNLLTFEHTTPKKKSKYQQFTYLTLISCLKRRI